MTNTRTWCALLLFAFAIPALAQYQTPTLDGVVSLNEYAHSSGNWSMTWNGTYLYIANNGLAPSQNSIVVYLDIDPNPTPYGGTDGNGNITGHADHGITPALPVRADDRIFVPCSTCGGAPEVRGKDYNGGWSAADTINSDITVATVGTTTEIRVRWDAIEGIDDIPTRFAWFAYAINTSAAPSVTDPMPAGNPTGTTPAPLDQYHYSITSTLDGASTDPFSNQQSTWRVTSNTD